MAITNTWSISQLDRITSDGFVHTAYYKVKAEDDVYNISAGGKVDLAKPDTLIPYKDLTHDQVLGWVKAKLNETDSNTTSNIEAALANNIAEQKAPTRASGVPW
jgi:hypothetical protein